MLLNYTPFAKGDRTIAIGSTMVLIGEAPFPMQLTAIKGGAGATLAAPPMTHK
jgi:hypothetical protein